MDTSNKIFIFVSLAMGTVFLFNSLVKTALSVGALYGLFYVCKHYIFEPKPLGGI